MVAVLVIAVLFALLGLAAARWGVDTRDGRDWQPYDVFAPRSGPPPAARTRHP